MRCQPVPPIEPLLSAAACLPVAPGAATPLGGPDARMFEQLLALGPGLSPPALTLPLSALSDGDDEDHDGDGE